MCRLYNVTLKMQPTGIPQPVSFALELKRLGTTLSVAHRALCDLTEGKIVTAVLIELEGFDIKTHLSGFGVDVVDIHEV